MIVRDYIVCDRRRGSLDEDAASVSESLIIDSPSAVLQRESIENGVALLSRNKYDYRIGVPRINGRDVRPVFTGDGNGLPFKVDMFTIGSVRHQHLITVVRGIDGRLDGTLLRRHFDGNGSPDRDGNLRRRILHVFTVVDRAAFDRRRPWH